MSHPADEQQKWQSVQATDSMKIQDFTGRLQTSNDALATRIPANPLVAKATRRKNPLNRMAPIPYCLVRGLLLPQVVVGPCFSWHPAEIPS